MNEFLQPRDKMAYRDNNTIPGNQTNTNSTSTTALVLNFRNLDTNAASTSNLQAVTAAGSSADAWITVGEEATGNFAFGRDDSDSGKLKITFDAGAPTPSDTDVFWSCTTAGEITKPLQPAFFANSAGAANVTGNGTEYAVGSSGTAFTEIYDQGGDFNTNGTFTAPVTGRYHFCANIAISGLTSAMTGVSYIFIDASNRDVSAYNGDVWAVGHGGGIIMSVTTYMDMDAADTAVVKVAVSGGTLVADIDANANTNFSGMLMA